MNKVISTNWVRAALAVSAITTGWMFYIFARAYDPTRLLDQAVIKSVSYSGIVPPYMQSVPTLLHALCMASLFSLACSRRSSFWLMWSVSTLGYEMLQLSFPSIGTFDGRDLLSIAFVIPVCFKISQKLSAESDQSRVRQTLCLVFAMASSVASAGPPATQSITHLPICMSAEEFRSAFLIDVPKTVKTAGKIHLNGNLLLVSEPFEGIHVFDNTDPAAPVPVAFISIPGNTDIAMKENLLYADSAVDLLTIKFQGNNAALANRLENVFAPRTPSDFSTDDVYVPEHKMEECTKGGGIVVGYTKRKDGDAFEKKIEENRK